MKNSIFPLLFGFCLIGCIKDQAFKRSFDTFTPISLQDGISTSQASEENMDTLALKQAYLLAHSENRFLGGKSLLVFRNGHLVAESYLQDKNDLYQPDNIQSMTKSITSLLVGTAIQQQSLISVDETIEVVAPELFQKDQTLLPMSLHQLLTMRSGIDFQNDKHTLQLYKEKKNSVEYILQLDKQSNPGTKVQYNDGDPHLVSAFIQAKTGKTLKQFAHSSLFQPLGINNYKWEAAKDQITYGAFGLHMTARDLGKIGSLLLNNGQWDGQTLVNPDYLNQATSSHVQLNFANNQPYGYYFWIDPMLEGYHASGQGGQLLFICPAKNLVVVYTAYPYTSGSIQDNAMELVKLIYNAAN